jgi:GTPase
MNKFDEFVKTLPPGTREIIRGIWETLPEGDRKNLLDLLGGIPTDANLMRSFVKLSTNELRLAFGNKQKVAIVGPANVGKSTLYNQFIQNKTDHAEVSPLPGTTRINRHADTGLFTIIDTPGADAIGEVGEKEQEEALSAAKEADFLIIIFDAIQGVKRNELDLYNQLVSIGKPYLVVMNKVDLARKETPQIIEKAAINLNLKQEQIIPIAAKNGENLDDILTAIAATEPEIVAALGASLPHFRWKLSWRMIVSAASLSAAIALAPLPVLDFGPLVVTQSVMVLGIARIYNYKITFARARELAVTFGLGFLGRTLFQELSKLGGLPGWLLSAAIASSTTVVMGYAASIWFESSKKLSSETLKKLTQTMTSYLLDVLRDITTRKPTTETLRERVEKALSNSPISENRKPLDDQAELKLE